MTDEQFAQLVEISLQTNYLLENIRFLAFACSLGVGYLAGQMTWHLVIVAKNQRTLL